MLTVAFLPWHTVARFPAIFESQLLDLLFGKGCNGTNQRNRLELCIPGTQREW